MCENYYYKSPVGLLKLSFDNDVLKRLSIENSSKENIYLSPTAKGVFYQLDLYFEGKLKTFEVDYKLEVSEFQQKVLNVIKTIEYGQVLTYTQVAERIGNINSSRAVGGACNKNPIAIIIPCHRVIGSNQKLVGYRYGLDMKNYLLNMEKNSLNY